MPKKLITPAIRTVDKDTGEIIVTDAVYENTPEHVAQEYKKSPYWKTPYNHDRNAESKRGGLVCNDPTKTQQHLAAEADINNILRKFMQTGQLPEMGQPRYGSAETLVDLQDIIVTGDQVQKAWDALPAAVRNILRDPQTLVAYVDHCLERGDLAPLQELGLAEPKKGSTQAPQAPPEPPEPPTPPTGGSPAPDGGKGPPGA